MIQTGTASATIGSLPRSSMPTVVSSPVRKPYPGDRGPAICDLHLWLANVEHDAGAKNAIRTHVGLTAIIDRWGFDDGWKWRIVGVYRGYQSGIRDVVKYAGMLGPCVSAPKYDLRRSHS